MEYTLYHATWCPFCRGFAPEFRRGLPDGGEYLLDDGVHLSNAGYAVWAVALEKIINA